MRYLSSLTSVAFLLYAVPTVVAAQTITQAVGLFNVFVGLMLTIALLAWATGFVVWWVRLGTWPSYRTEAITIMEWSVVILFVLVVLLGIVQFFQEHRRAAAYIVSTIVLVLLIGAIVVIATKGKKEVKKEEQRPPPGPPR
ncbi:hypothetical protein A3H16_03490 [Candidatus Kaiserbacteria bacterium RIFCSPLOWO2_12_FULL_53_8]|uniref:Uncharacterized protein n=2 Tax=Candidatus Kaiseribacteriota TaxID=1752734 RepID=A0A1F6CYA3_9BACT|nr:MAG: hypothetical protein A2851_01285 [Candidatus Kaiserbacteria bacterium RIFCSPHIGHO2_01_FULL_53_29]OGG91790.1 MAG: hypothetical protein A3H16_03490 [Candidatus Kaiserbacteria bacterium RIFCSPLOWO2_12_FULL_53_8]